MTVLRTLPGWKRAIGLWYTKSKYFVEPLFCEGISEEGNSEEFALRIAEIRRLPLYSLVVVGGGPFLSGDLPDS